MFRGAYTEHHDFAKSVILETSYKPNRENMVTRIRVYPLEQHYLIELSVVVEESVLLSSMVASSPMGLLSLEMCLL